MAQTSITNYFIKRKRTHEDFSNKAKVLRLDPEVYTVNEPVNDGNTTVVNLNSTVKESNQVRHIRKVLFDSKCEPPRKAIHESAATVNGNQTIKKSVNTERQPKQQGRIKKTAKQIRDPTVRDIREVLLGKKETEANNSYQETELSTEVKVNVSFELKGLLSPAKRKQSDVNVCSAEQKGTENVINTTENVPESNSDTGTKNELAHEDGFKTPKKVSPKDMSLEQLKKKLHRSAKMMEMRKHLERFNTAEEELKKLQNEKKDLGKLKLKQFQAIEIEIPVSPQKSIYSSPQKTGISPQTTPTKSPAYQRYASLGVPTTTPTLPLPFNYNHLAEVFRCVDTVSAMLHNRKETVTFRKLKPAVQEMLRRNFVESHLGQIRKVLPKAYDFHQQKCRNFGSMSKTETYDLILTPVAHLKGTGEETCGDSTSSMTPNCLLERRQNFLNNLLEIVKDHHEEHLKSLDPPLVIPREKLTRWHPGFDIDRVPDIIPETLPQPPNVEKYSTAKDVLDRAKNLFSCNQRMEKALQTVSEISRKTEESTSANPPVPDLLKGIPKALLEKIRAKQAAKALQAMTRSPAQDREAIQHVRLPEIARILRNVFVAEKKSVLPLEFVLEKLGHSYREKLPKAELQLHIKLIMSIDPDWLKLLHTRKMYFLRMAKDRDMASVMKRLEALAAEKNAT